MNKQANYFEYRVRNVNQVRNVFKIKRVNQIRHIIQI